MGTKGTEGRPSNKICVIVVDENRLHANAASCMLAKLNFQVMIHTSPIEALMFLQDHEKEIDFALVAVNMKEMHGFQFLDISKESHKNLQVIMMSDDITWPKIRRSVELGARFLVKKPLDEDTTNNIWQHLDLKFHPEKIKDLFKGIEGKRDGALKIGNKFGEGTNKRKASQLMWTPFLQKKFLEALKLLGDAATPKKVQLFMDVNSIGIKQISAHLQKHQKKIEKELCKKNANKCSNGASCSQPSPICETGPNTCQYDPETEDRSDEDMSWDQTESTEETQGKNINEAMRRALQFGVVFDESELTSDPSDKQASNDEVDMMGDGNGQDDWTYTFGDKNTVSETHSEENAKSPMDNGDSDKQVSDGDAQARFLKLVAYSSDSEDDEASTLD